MFERTIVAGMYRIDDDLHDELLALEMGDRVRVNDWKIPLTVRRCVGDTDAQLRFEVTGNGGTYHLVLRPDRPLVQLVRQPSARVELGYVPLDEMEVV